MDHLVSEYVEYHHQERPHQSLDNDVILKMGEGKPPDDGSVRCRKRLGGLLRHYYREAA